MLAAFGISTAGKRTAARVQLLEYWPLYASHMLTSTIVLMISCVSLSVRATRAGACRYVPSRRQIDWG